MQEGLVHLDQENLEAKKKHRAFLRLVEPNISAASIWFALLCFGLLTTKAEGFGSSLLAIGTVFRHRQRQIEMAHRARGGALSAMRLLRKEKIEREREKFRSGEGEGESAQF